MAQCLQQKIEFTILTQTRAKLGESPFWDPLRGCLWWVDVDGRRLLRTTISNGNTDMWPTPEVPGFVVLTQTGKPAIGMESGIFFFTPETGKFDQVIKLEAQNVRFNDATIDSAGRLWAATMDIAGNSPVGILYLVSSRRRLVSVVNGLNTPNGLAVDKVRSRLYLSDSHPGVQTIWVFGVEWFSGKLADRRIFAAMNGFNGRPDGATIDTTGNYWIAGVDGAVVHVFAPDGSHLREYKTPFDSPTKLVFGGQNLDQLYITSKGGGESNGSIAIGNASDSAPLRGRPTNGWQIED